MRKLNIYKVLVAIMLSVCMVLLVFYQRDKIKSSADESSETEVADDGVHTEVYFADGEDADIATGTDASAFISAVDSSDSIISGNKVYYGGQAYTRYYTVCRNGVKFKAYCGDHRKNAIRSTGNVSFGEDNAEMIRLAFACAPEADHEWNGFSGMTENDKQLIMALTLNYLRHGQYFPIISKYLEHIKSVDKSIIDLKCGETELAFVVEGKTGVKERDVTLENYKKYTVSGSKIERKRTKKIILVGNSKNYIEIYVPPHSWMHVRKNGQRDFKIYKSGKVKIDGGDCLFFTADVTYDGSEGQTYAEGKSGLTVYTADSNDTALDQQLLFAQNSDKQAVSINIKWSYDDDYGYMWLTKNKKFNMLKNSVANTTSYHAGAYGTENYSYAGIVYDIFDSKGDMVDRMALSYDGICYVGRSSGKPVVLRSKAEKDRCIEKIDMRYVKLPYGNYSVKENEYLWKLDHETRNLSSTGKRVHSSGYKYNSKTYTVSITEKNRNKSKMDAFHIAAEDEAITGKFSLKKTDADTQTPVMDAVYYVERKASGATSVDSVVAKFKTDSDGNGVVYATKYGSTGSRYLTDLPIGIYIIYENVFTPKP